MSGQRALPLSPAAVDVLARATVAADGHGVHLPPGQLPRPLYAEVDKALRRIGGRWDRRSRSHVFDRPAAEALGEVLRSGQAPPDADKVASFWRTPRAVADLMVELADVRAGHRVLEPSAGDGAILDRLIRLAPARLVLTAVEPDPHRAGVLAGKGYLPVELTLEEFAARPRHRGAFDRVLANPPFTTARDSKAWTVHLTLIWDLLAPGGRAVVVLPDTRASSHMRAQEAWALVDEAGRVVELPADAFAVSGTQVRAVLAVLDRPGGSPGRG